MSISADDLIALIRARGRGDPTSALGEIFVVPTITVAQYLDTKVQFARIEQTLDTVLATLEDPVALTTLATNLNETVTNIQFRLQRAIDDAASNFGILRRPAVASRGTVIVYRSTPLTAAFTLPSGFQFYATSLQQEYIASDTTQIASMSYDINTSRYVASVPVQSSNVGLDTVASVSQITTIRDASSQLEGVTNTVPVVGGRDLESDRDLVARIKTALSANNIGTKSGYRNLVLLLDAVKDASVVGAGDALMARDLSDGGSVDIYVTDIVPVQASDNGSVDNLDPATNTIFTPARQPILDDVTSVTPTPSFITKDGSVYAGSVRAKDTITFPSTVLGAPITFFVNDNVNATQLFLDDPERKILGSDVLVKEAVTVLVTVIFKIVVLSGFTDKSVVATNVQNGITQFISALGIGQSLDQSDVLQIAVNTPGVDRVILPMTQFNRPGSVLAQEDVITATANEVLRVNTVAINY